MARPLLGRHLPSVAQNLRNPTLIGTKRGPKYYTLTGTNPQKGTLCGTQADLLFKSGLLGQLLACSADNSADLLQFLTLGLSQVYGILWAHLGYLSNIGMPWDIIGKCDYVTGSVTG